MHIKELDENQDVTHAGVEALVPAQVFPAATSQAAGPGNREPEFIAGELLIPLFLSSTPILRFVAANLSTRDFIEFYRAVPFALQPHLEHMLSMRLACLSHQELKNYYHMIQPPLGGIVKNLNQRISTLYGRVPVEYQHALTVPMIKRAFFKDIGNFEFTDFIRTEVLSIGTSSGYQLMDDLVICLGMSAQMAMRNPNLFAQSIAPAQRRKKEMIAQLSNIGIGMAWIVHFLSGDKSVPNNFVGIEQVDIGRHTPFRVRVLIHTLPFSFSYAVFLAITKENLDNLFSANPLFFYKGQDYGSEHEVLSRSASIDAAIDYFSGILIQYISFFLLIQILAAPDYFDSDEIVNSFFHKDGTLAHDKYSDFASDVLMDLCGDIKSINKSFFYSPALKRFAVGAKYTKSLLCYALLAPSAILMSPIIYIMILPASILQDHEEFFRNRPHTRRNIYRFSFDQFILNLLGFGVSIPVILKFLFSDIPNSFIMNHVSCAVADDYRSPQQCYHFSNYTPSNLSWHSGYYDYDNASFTEQDTCLQFIHAKILMASIAGISAYYATRKCYLYTASKKPEIVYGINAVSGALTTAVRSTSSYIGSAATSVYNKVRYGLHFAYNRQENTEPLDGLTPGTTSKEPQHGAPLLGTMR